MMFALLCSEISAAVASFQQTPALIPLTLLAAIDIPIPVPQTRMPRSALPEATASATFCA
jgi:hypothetical protein